MRRERGQEEAGLRDVPGPQGRVADLPRGRLRAVVQDRGVHDAGQEGCEAYTVYVLLTISQVSRMFKGYEEDPLSTVIAVGITLAIVFYAAWIKTLLFPDLGFIGAKKIKGQFVFSN